LAETGRPKLPVAGNPIGGNRSPETAGRRKARLARSPDRRQPGLRPGASGSTARRGSPAPRLAPRRISRRTWPPRRAGGRPAGRGDGNVRFVGL